MANSAKSDRAAFPTGARSAAVRDARLLEFDHRAARHRDLAGDAHRAPLRQMERRVLLVIDVLARRAVDRNDDLVVALCRARSRADGGPLERVAADDHGLDAGFLERRLESRAQEFIRPT